MFERFTHRARRAVVLAQEEARSLKQSYIDTEHVLLGLLHQDDSTAVKALRLAGVDLARLRAKAREISGLGTYDLTSHIPFTRQTKTVLEKSLQEARGAGGDIVGTEHMLMALIDETRGGHTVALRSLGIDVVTLREAAVVQSGPPKKMTVIDSIAAELNLTSEAVLAIGQPELATRIRGLRRRLERVGEQDFSTKSKLAAIFVSYRRRDSSHVAGRIYDQVSRTIGANRVFMDIESIQIGVNFHEVIATALGQSGVLLAIIGPDWAPSVELGRRSRLFETGDLVRFEISTALLHGLRVVPVLVDDAAMPKEVDLPIDLRVLPRLNAFRVNHASFVKDVQQLLDSIFEVG